MKRSPPPRRKKPMARGSSQLKRAPIKRESVKRRSEQANRRIVRDEALARDVTCIAADVVPELHCWGPLDADEYDPRSQRPGGHLDASNVQMLCRAHHDWKDAEPIEAARRGLRPFPRGYMGEDSSADRQMPARGIWSVTRVARSNDSDTHAMGEASDEMGPNRAARRARTAPPKGL